MGGALHGELRWLGGKNGWGGGNPARCLLRVIDGNPPVSRRRQLHCCILFRAQSATNRCLLRTCRCLSHAFPDRVQNDRPGCASFSRLQSLQALASRTIGSWSGRARRWAATIPGGEMLPKSQESASPHTVIFPDSEYQISLPPGCGLAISSHLPERTPLTAPQTQDTFMYVSYLLSL